MGLGSIAFVQEPIGDSTTSPVITNWNPIVPYTVHQDDISSLFYFKLILEVRFDDASGTLLAKIKQRRNGYAADVTADEARATFDLRDIVNSQLELTIVDQNSTTNSIHTLGANATTKPYSQNSNQVQTIYVKAYQEYSLSANISPTEDLTPTVNDTKRYIAASLDLNTARGTDDFQITAFSKYSLDGATKLFLSDIEDSVAEYNLGSVKRNYLQDTDYHTIAFLNDDSAFDSTLKYIQIKYYTVGGAQIGVTNYITNNNTYGGAIPDSEVNTDEERLIYFGCGAANLEALTTPLNGANPSNFADWAYYTISGTSTTGGSPTYKTSTYYFIKQDGSCKGFKVRRLAWRNSLGAYDYFNFKMKSTQTIEVTRYNYESLLGNFSSDMYSYDNFGRGKNTIKVDAVLKETLQTDYITEQDAILLENLIKSTNVFIIENADTTYTVPVMVTSNSFVRKTSANDKLIKYTINIEYANPINTNS